MTGRRRVRGEAGSDDRGGRRDPVFFLFVLFVVAAGRMVLAQQSVQAAAADAARSASIARTATEARSSAAQSARGSLARQGLACRTLQVSVDVSGFNRPVGTPAFTAASVTCVIAWGDLAALPGLAGVTRTVQATMTSPLDTYRGRR